MQSIRNVMNSTIFKVSFATSFVAFSMYTYMLYRKAKLEIIRNIKPLLKKECLIRKFNISNVKYKITLNLTHPQNYLLSK
jgi:hypothetical protein